MSNYPCGKCGKFMVELPPTVIYYTFPACWDKIVKCFGCDITENLGVIYEETPKSPEQIWKELNGIND